MIEIRKVMEEGRNMVLKIKKMIDEKRRLGKMVKKLMIEKIVDWKKRKRRRNREWGNGRKMEGEGIGGRKEDLREWESREKWIRLKRDGGEGKVEKRGDFKEMRIEIEKRRKCIRSLERMRKENGKRIIRERNLEVEELRRDIDIERKERNMLKKVFRKSWGIIGSEERGDSKEIEIDEIDKDRLIEKIESSEVEIIGKSVGNELRMIENLIMNEVEMVEIR